MANIHIRNKKIDVSTLPEVPYEIGVNPIIPAEYKDEAAWAAKPLKDNKWMRVCVSMIAIGLAGLASNISWLLLLIISWTLVVSGFVCVALIVYIRNGLRKRLTHKKSLENFAAANGFKPAQTLNMEPGDEPFIRFLSGRHEVRDIYSSKIDGWDASFFTYVVETGSGNNKETTFFGGLHFKLPTRFPHLVLDSRKNDGIISSIPIYYDDSQRIELEGNFNEYFDFFAPEGYEVEALDILSPEFMAMLIDFHTPYDVEIDGRDAYILTRGSVYGRKKMIELAAAAEYLIGRMQHKSKSWSFNTMGAKTPELIFHKNQSAARIGKWRISGYYLLAPVLIIIVVSVYALFALMNIIAFNPMVAAGIMVVLTIGLIIEKRFFRRGDKQ